MFFFVHGHRDGVWWRSAKMDRMTEVGGYTPSFEWTLVFIVKKFCLCLLFLLKQISFYFIENCTKRCLICSRENMLKQLRFYIWFENQDGHFSPTASGRFSPGMVLHSPGNVNVRAPGGVPDVTSTSGHPAGCQRPCEALGHPALSYVCLECNGAFAEDS